MLSAMSRFVAPAARPAYRLISGSAGRAHPRGEPHGTALPLRSRILPGVLSLGLVATVVLPCGTMAAEPAATITPADNGAMQVHLDGELFTVYRPRDADRPFFYPVLGPKGRPMTRHWPMEEADGEQEDHRHHRGLWYAHGDMNGHDFWSEGAGARILQTRAEVKEGGVLITENSWISAAGETVCTDRRRHRFSAGDGYRQIDFEIALVASAGRVIMGDTKEGSMAIRVPATLRVEGDVAKGRLVTSEGRRDGEAWGTRAGWCASVGPVAGQMVGVTIMDHPTNPRHPSWWHARTYGLLAANAVGQHYFEKKAKGAGDLVIEPGRPITFWYRIRFHEGDTQTARSAEHYTAFGAEPRKDSDP